VVQYWLSVHDALRLRFIRVNGAWQQLCTAEVVEIPVSFHDLSKIPPGDRARVVEEVATNLQQSLNFSNGPLIGVGWFDTGADEPARMLITIHHLVVDAVSWRILLDDFVGFCEAKWEGKSFQPHRGISFRGWSEHLTKLARDKSFLAEREYWTKIVRPPFASLPLDHTASGHNTVCSVSTIRVQLETSETRRLLEAAPTTHRTTINELLLTALAKTLHDWTGASSLLVDVEGHGREDITAGLDTSGTVGWFTTISPVVLDAQAHASLPEILRRVKERLRNIPHHGLGFGVLRYLSDDATRQHLQDLPRGELLFNYFGQFDRNWPSSWLSVARESTGPLQGPENHRPYLIEVSCGVHDGRLLIEWRYSEHLHRRQTIEKLAQHFMCFLRELTTASEKAQPSALSPSDFSATRMSQGDFEKLISKIKPSVERRPQ
jgi:non-ribosomal peptide synthase protein (TIGR01720 family)